MISMASVFQLSKVPWFHACKVEGFMGCHSAWVQEDLVPRFKDSNIPRLHGCGVPCKVSAFHSSKFRRLQISSTVQRLHGCKVPKLPSSRGLNGFRVPKLQCFSVPRLHAG